MAGYSDTKDKILTTLVNRPVGEEIQPDKHQAYALSMLEYIRNLELIAVSPLIGVANEYTTPVQPNTSRVSYLAAVNSGQTIVFHNFHDLDGNPISVEASDDSAVIVLLLWDGQYWDFKAIPTGVILSPEGGVVNYGVTIKRTYSSVAGMNSDSVIPIGDDGKKIKVGELVSVVNPNDANENAIYSRTSDGWKFQGSVNVNISSSFGESASIAISQKFFTQLAKYVLSGQIELTATTFNKLNDYNSVAKVGLYTLMMDSAPIAYLSVFPHKNGVKQVIIGALGITEAKNLAKISGSSEIVRYYENGAWSDYKYKQADELANEFGDSVVKGVSQKFFSENIQGRVLSSIEINSINNIDAVLADYNSPDKVGIYSLTSNGEKWGLLEISSSLSRDLLVQKITSNLTLDSYGAILKQNEGKFKTIIRVYNINNINIEKPRAGFWTVWGYETNEENVVLSEGEYNLLVANGAVNPNTFYYIYEE